MSDSKYFSTTKKGELAELKAELNDPKKEKKKEAVKKIIANMTVGKDVSSLFPDVVNCMQTDNLELKKLVYLYLMNYAKSQPDLAIMAVNTFAKDCEDPNPLIRALAVRTMGCIRVDKITEYLCEPLRKCLKDEDPYVRKTAAVCVAKLHDINSTLVEDQGFLDMLKELLSDSVPMVVANAVAALTEISETSPAAAQVNELDTAGVNKLLTALNECTEWGQVFILDALAAYVPANEREAQNVCDRITPRLSHANAAVVLSAVKVLMKLMEQLSGDDNYVQNLQRKLAPPLVTLLSCEPEVQYVALRNINLIVQKRSEVLKDEIKVFFVKYNDPIFVKLEKLDIMIRLATELNMATVLSELKEYSTEVDVDFVRKSVRAIGRCAIKVEASAERCVSTLLELIQTKLSYVMQEAIIVIKDIFRKYPNKYESIISTLCENLDSLDEPEARASMIWILGEYAERIDNADELLGSFLDGYQDEDSQVQLQLLTAIVKLFLKRPQETQNLVQSVLSLATQDSDNPDLRDRGYIYWRLLSTDPAAAKEVVLAEKPLIAEETDLLEPTLLDELICHISSLASVYHKPPTSFVEGKAPIRRITLQPRAEPSASEDTEEQPPAQPEVVPTVIQPAVAADNLIGDLLSLDLPTAMPGGGGTMASSSGGIGDLDFLTGDLGGLNMGGGIPPGNMGGGVPPGIMGGVGVPPPASDLSSLGLSQDLLGLQSTTASSGPVVLPQKSWLTAAAAKGLEVSGTFALRNGAITMEMMFSNRALQAMGGLEIQLNKNSFGLYQTSPLSVPPTVHPNKSVSGSVILGAGGSVLRQNPLNMLQVAIKNNVGIFYFSTEVPPHVLFASDGKMDRKVFLATWKDIPGDKEVIARLPDTSMTTDQVVAKLEENNVFLIAKKTVGQQDLIYASLQFVNKIWVLVELKKTDASLQVSMKTTVVEVSGLVEQAFKDILAV